MTVRAGLFAMLSLLLASVSHAQRADDRPLLVTNGVVTVRAVRDNGIFAGFDVLSEKRTVAVVRFSSSRLLTAARCRAEGGSLLFTGLQAKPETGAQLGAQDRIAVALTPKSPYPVVRFDLSLTAFDPERWQAVAGKQPFHFLALYLPNAEVWHQCGWLNATPLADPFPLLLDRHAGTPEISAYPYNRDWSYTPPLGAHPIPVIGLWAPQAKQYVGFEFQTTRLEDNSEKDIATGYCWAGDTGAPGQTNRPVRKQPQFVALVYPYGGVGYQQLVFPQSGARIASHGTLLWNLNLPATDDPNRFFFTYLFNHAKDRLPRVPAGVDLSWLPGGIRLRDFEGPPQGGLIAGVEGSFQVPGTRLISGWRWHNEFPTQVAKARGDTERLQALEQEAATLLPYAKRFVIDGEDCVYWEKPLEGQWTEAWGGEAVTTLHNANGFAAGRLFLGLYRDLGKTDYLPIVDGVLHWAEHICWTRNEFADVPSSPFAIGGTLSASFCLDYYLTFRGAPDAEHRAEAQRALDLARTFTYRYLVMWPSDNDRTDNRDPAFLWEPNSGRDWTGAACCNEVCWNLDTLAQTAVHTGDPILMWALQGALNRWPALYQDRYKDSLADYASGDMTEGYGLYAGNVYGVGQRAPYGFASPLAMIEPVGDSVVRVLAGERAAMVFNRDGVHTGIRDYRYRPSGNLAFTLRSLRPQFDLSLTVPYVDLSDRPVAVVRDGKTISLQPGQDVIRPPQALWSLTLKGLRPDDRVVIGAPDESSPVLPSLPPLTQGQEGLYVPPASGPSEVVPLAYDAFPDMQWAHLDSWAGLPRGPLWAFGIQFALPPNGGRSTVTKPLTLEHPIVGTDAIAVLYSAGDGPPPTVLFADGSKQAVDATREALAWRAWPPLYTARLLVAPVQTGGKTVTGLDPGGRAVWAVSALRQTATTDDLTQTLDRLHVAAADWQRMRQEESVLAQLRQEVVQAPEGAVAFLPPEPSGPAIDLFLRAGFGKRSETLTPDRLIDPAYFTAQRFPAAVYAGGEEYLHTVHTSGDAADALVRYVEEGGTLLLLSPLPWPLYYAVGPDFHRPEPLTERLGLPLKTAVETAPPEPLRVELAPQQTVLADVPATFPYPSGDPRLRSIDRKRLPEGAKYTPIYTVRGQNGTDYGDAAGLIELPRGQGRILYVANILLRSKEQGPILLRAVTRFLIAAARGVEARP